MGASTAAGAAGAVPSPASLQEALAMQQQQQRMQQLVAAGALGGGGAGAAPPPRGDAPLTLAQQG